MMVVLGGVTLVVYVSRVPVRYGTECNRVDAPRETCLDIYSPRIAQLGRTRAACLVTTLG